MPAPPLQRNVPDIVNVPCKSSHADKRVENAEFLASEKNTQLLVKRGSAGRVKSATGAGVP